MIARKAVLESANADTTSRLARRPVAKFIPAQLCPGKIAQAEAVAIQFCSLYSSAIEDL